MSTAASRLLKAGALGFGALALCAAVVSAFSLPGLFAGPHEGYAGALLMIALPGLLLGAGGAWACRLLLARQQGLTQGKQPD